jgi:tetratricopeptide (TPR) repeat protein
VADSQAERIDVSKLSNVSAAALELEATWHSQREHEKDDVVSFANRYRLLLATEPGNADALRGLGVMLLEAGEYQQSLSHLQQAVKEAPGDPRNNLALARLLDLMEASRGTTADLASSAEQEAAAALALDPDYADAYFLQASALARHGQLEKAGALMRKAVALSPRTDAYKLTMADVDLQLRDYSPANVLLHRLTRSRDPEIARKAESFLSTSAKRASADAR